VRALAWLALAAVLGAPACDSATLPAGLDEPIRVRAAVFKGGELPGTAPDPAAPVAPVAITLVESTNSVVVAGLAAKNLSGRASADAVAVAVRFADLGSGYWVFPVGAPDPSNGGELTWASSAGIGWDVPAGFHELRFVAIDANGQAGRQVSLKLCVTAAVPDNLNACDPSLAPPDTVLALSWDTDVDLDLVVVTPEGKRVDGHHPSTVLPGDDGRISAAELAAPHVGVLDRDSNGECVIDGVNGENLVWQTAPLPGRYQVFASLYASCGKPAVRFSAVLYQAFDQEGGTRHLVETKRVAGELTALAAQGGAGEGLFLMELPL
jgi:hypothetical protein